MNLLHIDVKIFLCLGFITCWFFQSEGTFNPSALVIYARDQFPDEVPDPYSEKIYRKVAITFINRGNEAIVVGPDMLPSDMVLQQDELTSRLTSGWRTAKRVWLAFAVASVSFGGYRYVFPATRHPDEGEITLLISLIASAIFLYTSVICGAVERGEASSILYTGIFAPVVVRPGEIVTRMIYFDTKTQLPSTYECRVTDSTGMRYTVTANPFMMS